MHEIVNEWIMKEWERPRDIIGQDAEVAHSTGYCQPFRSSFETGFAGAELLCLSCNM